MRTAARRGEGRGDAHLPPCCAAGVRPKPGALTSGYPETLSCFCRDRRRPRQTPNFRRRRGRRRRRRLSGQMGVTWGPSWVRLRSASPALTRSADVPRRRRWPLRSLRVTQFSPGPRQPGVGERRAESTLGAGALGGLACATPRVGALRGGGSAPCW